MRYFLIFMVSLLAAAFPVFGQEAGAAAVVSESYRLSDRDLVKFWVQDEPETAVEQRIDGNGVIRVPYIGTVKIQGLTVREAEDVIEKAYVEQEIYRKLQATLQVLQYSTKEVSVLGQVRQPGKVVFPIEANEVDIVNIITEAGGFTGIARSREVRVTRTSADGNDETFTVDVDRMLSGSSQRGVFLVQPGDVVFVPERLF